MEKRWRFIVWYQKWFYEFLLVSNADAALLTSHDIPPPGHRTQFIHTPSQLPGEHTAWQPQVLVHITNHICTTCVTSLLIPTRYPLLRLGWEGARVGKDLAQEHSVTANSAPPATEPQVLVASRACYHWAMTPLVRHLRHLNTWCIQCRSNLNFEERVHKLKQCANNDVWPLWWLCAALLLKGHEETAQ